MHVARQKRQRLLLFRYLVKSLAVLWASPWTLLGLTIGVVCCTFGAKLHFYRGAIVSYGRPVRRLLDKVPIASGARAMTLGHTILAVDYASMVATHSHEAIHIRQYERWGPFFVPAYLLSSLYLLLRKRDPYWENPFEMQAYYEENR